MSWGSEGGAEVVEKWCIWRCFLVGFCMDFCSTLGSDKFRGWPPRGGPHSFKSDIFLVSVDRGCDLGIVFGTLCRPGRRKKENV